MPSNFYNALLVLYGLDKPSFTAKLKKVNCFEESATRKFNEIESVLANRRGRTYALIFSKHVFFLVNIEGGAKSVTGKNCEQVTSKNRNE